MTLRSEGQFNTVVYEARGRLPREPPARRRDDVRRRRGAARRRRGERVVVETEVGRLEVSVAIVDIRAGSLGDVTTRRRTRSSRAVSTRGRGRRPFKSVAVRVRRAGTTAA